MNAHFNTRPLAHRTGLAVVLAAALAGCATSPQPPEPASPKTTAPHAQPHAQASAEPAAPPTAVVPHAAPPSDEAARFAAWLAAFRAEARAAGIREATLQAALDPAQLRPRTIELDRNQAEFTRAIWDYLDTAVSPTRVANGQARLAQVQREADAASARYGVPVAVLMAVWGMESNYGGNYGDVPVVDALATLAFEGRREAWARQELLTALRIIDQGHIDRAHMIGSWAGAMGQTQFMPSAFMAHAVDADGDGRRDIWRSMADVLASTANYLHKAGWRSGEPCAHEVVLPPGFDPERADPAVRQATSQWAQEGVRSVAGDRLPDMADAAILQPAGVHGPAFLAGANFRAVLRYNNATSYALGVCHLAHRIAGGGPISAPWPRDQRPLSRSEVQALQTALARRGLNPGAADGVMGPATRSAVRAFQRSLGLPADGFATATLLERAMTP